MTDTYCEKHNIGKDVIGGCSAHRANWYCVECDKESYTSGHTEVIMTKDDEETRKLTNIIEDEIAQNEISKCQVFTQMNQIICSLNKENEQMKQDLVEISNFIFNIKCKM